MVSIRYKNVRKLYVTQCIGQSILLLDDYAFQKTIELADYLNEVNTVKIMIPLDYTSVVQLCDLGINKPLKDRLKKRVAKWTRANLNQLHLVLDYRTPKRADILQWLAEIWQKFSTKIVKNRFAESGYVYENEMDYSGATDFESDAN